VSDEFTEPTQDPQEPEDNQAPAEPDELDAALAEILDAAEAEAEAAPKSEVEQLQELVAERTGDLQRLHAEYANYKKRVDRDRALSRAGGIEAVVLDLLPVLDSVEAAREHSELVGGFKLVAEELEKITAKYGLETFGEVGEPFDPQIHEALMQMPMAGDFDVPTVSAVMQRGVRLNDRVIRPARVGVADPDAE
jgi:molecular chaperone GrpE